MKKISGVKVPKLKAPKESMPKAPKKQAKPSSSVSKGTFGAEMRKVQKRAKPKAGKIPVI
ncbi:hypothetical protein ACFSHT_22490 [Paraburkholderia silviterrae]|uniref:Uncharacterized protein n=1 Tax=Paraburkholderia silviterrae TaxID=2528715 RepID=A0A4R5MGH6_9BURK|nr:hypothetical protein [Paraburkholderia silviterrae]TDG25850.1 hypothetical protein EYW47_00320 [Paraburkholderia silviterrae]